MSIAAKSVVLIEILVASAVVVALVFCENYMTRVGVGVGILTTIAPLTIWQSIKRATKIGFDSGYIRAEADMIREHCRLGKDD